MNTPKTITFRTDEATYEKIEKLKETLFQGKEVSNSEVLRYAIDSIYNHQDKRFYDDDEILKLIQSFILAGFFKSAYDIDELYSFVNYEILASILGMVEEVYGDHTFPEVREFGGLYIDEEPLTIGKLVRFKHRTLPVWFLKAMREWKKEYEDLTDEELADLILKKFSDERFKKNAEELFGIK